MKTTEQNISQKSNILKASAKQVATLALAERKLADQQHLLAHRLEILADDLNEQAAEVEGEMKATDTP